MGRIMSMNMRILPITTMGMITMRTITTSSGRVNPACSGG